MSLEFEHQEKLDESGSTDNAEDRSCEGERAGILSTNEFSLDLYYTSSFLRTQPGPSVKSELYDSTLRESSPASGQVTPKEHYQPSEQFEQQYKHCWSNSMYEADNTSNDTTRLGSGKNWPSLQIVCPESPPPQYQGSDFASSPSMHAGSGGEAQRSRMVGSYAGVRPMAYYPSTHTGMLLEESPASYHKMRPAAGFAYSPAHAAPAGYRSNVYGMPLTPRGGAMHQASPVRSPAVNRRFMEPIDGYIYQVQFKRAHKNFILAPSAPRNIIPGDFVKVEADRGEDMGIVLSKSPASEFEEVIPTAGYRGRGFSSGQGERKFLFRLANADERAALVTKVQDEERALEVIRGKVMEQLLPMTILDAEYQFDRHKLTFFFEADRRIDFRELVSELFSLYKTRIWMQQVDTTVLGMSDAGAELAKATGFLPERDDHAYLQTTSHMRRLDGSGGGSVGRGLGGGMRAHDPPLAYQHHPEPPPSYTSMSQQSQRAPPSAVQQPLSLGMQAPPSRDFARPGARDSGYMVVPPEEQDRPFFQPRGDRFAPAVDRAPLPPPPSQMLFPSPQPPNPPRQMAVPRLPMAAQPLSMGLGLGMGMGMGPGGGGGGGGGSTASVGGRESPSAGAMSSFFSLSPLQGPTAPGAWPFSPPQPQQQQQQQLLPQPGPLLFAPQYQPQPPLPPPAQKQQHRFSPYAAPFRPSSELLSHSQHHSQHHSELYCEDPRGERRSPLEGEGEGGTQDRETATGHHQHRQHQHSQLQDSQARDFALEMGLQRLSVSQGQEEDVHARRGREWKEQGEERGQDETQQGTYSA